MSSQPRTYTHLTPSQITSFMTHGFLRVPSAFTPSQAAHFTRNVWTRLGFSPADKSTWSRERTNMPEHSSVLVSDFSPEAWNAICELVGGEERLSEDAKFRTWNDGFIVNLGTEEGAGKVVGPKDLDGWHVDGDFFTHFLDSPEQGLLVIPLWSDIVENGGGTMVCSDGIGRVARWLEAHPEGVSPRMVPRGQEPRHQGLGFYSELVQECEEFHEMTGKVGDVILMHPLMVHSASKNGLRLPRIITNPPVSMKIPFNFDRDDPAEYSLVELKTLKELGKQRLTGWKIAGTRDVVVPERLKVQNKMKEEELQRLAELKQRESVPQTSVAA